MQPGNYSIISWTYFHSTSNVIRRQRDRLITRLLTTSDTQSGSFAEEDVQKLYQREAQNKKDYNKHIRFEPSFEAGRMCIR